MPSSAHTLYCPKPNLDAVCRVLRGCAAATLSTPVRFAVSVPKSPGGNFIEDILRAARGVPCCAEWSPPWQKKDIFSPPGSQKAPGRKVLFPQERPHKEKEREPLSVSTPAHVQRGCESPSRNRDSRGRCAYAVDTDDTGESTPLIQESRAVLDPTRHMSGIEPPLRVPCSLPLP